MRRLVAALALLALGVAVLVAPAPAATPRAAASPHKPFRIGMAFGDTLTWRSDADLAAALDDAVQLGVGWIRVDLSWADIQPNGPDEYLWQRFDRVAKAARQRGLRVLPILTYTPSWARDDGCETFTCPPRDPAQFAEFAGLAAHRYSRLGIHTWEIWNEENFAWFWTSPDPERYAILLRSARRAIIDQDAKAGIVMGGLAAVKTRSDGSLHPSTFLRRVCAARGCVGLQAIGYHPYTYPYLASYDASWVTPWDVIASSKNSLRHVLDQAGYRHKRIWVTEYGAPTGGPGTASDGSAGSITASTTHVTERRQGVIAADALRSAAASPDVAALFWYTDRDNPRHESKEDFYGLRRADGTKKPAWSRFRTVTRSLTPGPSGN